MPETRYSIPQKQGKENRIVTAYKIKIDEKLSKLHLLS